MINNIDAESTDLVVFRVALLLDFRTEVSHGCDHEAEYVFVVLIAEVFA